MTGSKVYLQPRDYVFNTIHDVKEMQKGKGTFADVVNGKINFIVRLYYAIWEYQFTVTDIGKNRCRVEIGVGGDVRNKEDKILREFSLLESMLLTNSNIELIKEQSESGGNAG